MEQNEEKRYSMKKNRRGSAEMKKKAPPQPAAQTCTNRERQQANHERAAPAFPAKTAKTKTGERATTPSSVSSARAPNDPKVKPRPPTPSSTPSLTSLTESERKASEEAEAEKMEGDDCSEEDVPESGRNVDDEPRNVEGDTQSYQKLESSAEPSRTLRRNCKKPRYTQPPPAK